MYLLRGVRLGVAAISICGTGIGALAGDKKDEPKPTASQEVDTGSFGVIVRGQRVMTESFSIQQENGISIVKSRLEQAGNSPAVNQNSELRMTGSGELVRYDWTDGSGSLVVTPKDEFLQEKIMASPTAKAAEQPFLMPNTSAILDNNFFIQREVLVWRYLATNCHSDSGKQKCLQAPLEFGALVPQDRSSIRVRMEWGGRGKVMIRDVERDLLRLDLKGESFKWTLWIDDNDHFKIIRVDVPDDNTEVVRD